jgi:hypothetical protein
VCRSGSRTAPLFRRSAILARWARRWAGSRLEAAPAGWGGVPGRFAAGSRSCRVGWCAGPVRGWKPLLQGGVGCRSGSRTAPLFRRSAILARWARRWSGSRLEAAPTGWGGVPGRFAAGSRSCPREGLTGGDRRHLGGDARPGGSVQSAISGGDRAGPRVMPALRSPCLRGDAAPLSHAAACAMLHVVPQQPGCTRSVYAHSESMNKEE